MYYCLVLGDPIEHSLSPVIHREAYRVLGLDWEFHPRRLRPEQLADFLAQLDGDCRGLAVTMPLKPQALALATYRDGLAKVTGAVNTLVPGPGGTWAGFNTDVYGIVQAFREGMEETRGEDGGALPGETRVDNGGGVFGTRVVFGGASAVSAGFEGLIFGSGSTAASAVAAMVQLGVRRLSVVSRHPSPQTPVAQAATAMGVRLGQVSWQDSAGLQQLCHSAHLVMNTIPGPQQSQLELPGLHRGAVVLDAAYDPWPTPVARWAETVGAKVIAGWNMLLHQAVAQLKLFTGAEVAPEPLREALESALSKGR